jgi:hypothetical protein
VGATKREAPRAKRALRTFFEISFRCCVAPLIFDSLSLSLCPLVVSLLLLVVPLEASRWSLVAGPRGALRAQTGCRGLASRARSPWPSKTH